MENINDNGNGNAIANGIAIAKGIVMDNGAAKVIDVLENAGFEAYAVGGCVRDALMGLEPEDWDITTSARPEEVKALFDRTFDTGIEHGTVTVRLGGKSYEVTTYRMDGTYLDHRRPDHVFYTSSLYEDVRRRDFTINAMAYHPRRGLMDFFHGREDLRQGVIRCVGTARHRFEEDALRMLRAVRFSTRLQFDIESETLEAIMALAPTLEAVSRERVMDELTKTLMCSHPEGLRMLETTGLANYLCPELKADRTLDYDAPGRVSAEGDWGRALRLSAWLWPLGSRRSAIVMKQLKSDNRTTTRVSELTGHVRDPLPADAVSMRRMMRLCGKDMVMPLMELMNACGTAGEDDVQRAKDLYEQEKERPVSLKDLAIKGSDVPCSGPKVGQVLEELLSEVVEDPSRNRADYLKERAAKLAKSL